MTKMHLQDARAMLRVSQEKLAKRAKVSPVTISACERGMSIRRSSAYAILGAINEFRQEKGMQTLTLHDIKWKIV